MIIKNKEHIGKFNNDNVKGFIAAYKTNPQDVNKALKAGYAYSLKINNDIIVVPGNSYMNKVYHICKVDDELSKFGYNKKQTIDGYLVNTNGDVYKCKLNG